MPEAPCVPQTTRAEEAVAEKHEVKTGALLGHVVLSPLAPGAAGDSSPTDAPAPRGRRPLPQVLVASAVAPAEPEQPKGKSLWKAAAVKVEVRTARHVLLSARAPVRLPANLFADRAPRPPTSRQRQKMAKIISVFKPSGAGVKKAPAAKSASAVSAAAATKARLGWGVGPATNERRKMLQGKHAKMVTRLEAPIVRRPLRPSALPSSRAILRAISIFSPWCGFILRLALLLTARPLSPRTHPPHPPSHPQNHPALTDEVKLELTQREIDRTPFWEQGNLIYYSEDMIVARMRHLDSKKINEAIDLWLKVIPKMPVGMTIGPGGVVRHAHIFVAKEAYIEMAGKINRALRPGQSDETILAEAEEDWAEDSDGARFMNEAQFRYALFQLADLWTDSVDSDDYVKCATPRTRRTGRSAA